MKQPFWPIATAGIFFQGGAAAVDTGTIVAALVNGLTGSAVAVGAAAAIARYGWLFPQLFVGYWAQRRRRRMPFYMLGAFGRVACLGGVALLVAGSGRLPESLLVTAFFVLWTLYAFVSGIVAVPYNDIVARSIPSGARSRLLAIRFFGGGLLALMVAGAAHRLLGALPFPAGHATVLALGAGLLFASALSFVSAGEAEAPLTRQGEAGFLAFLKEGRAVFHEEARFRLFVYARWLSGTAAMALPFYAVQALASGVDSKGVAVLLGAQTAGGLVSNPLWGWWGDRIGKRALLEASAAVAVLAPVLTLLVWWGAGATVFAPLSWFVVVFFILGAASNSGTIAQLGYLMEISPDPQRPAYSGYFNAIVAPAALSPIAGAGLVDGFGLPIVFVASAVAAVVQVLVIHRLRSLDTTGAPA